jgi:hypothetical protein
MRLKSEAQKYERKQPNLKFWSDKNLARNLRPDRKSNMESQSPGSTRHTGVEAPAAVEMRSRSDSRWAKMGETQPAETAATSRGRTRRRFVPGRRSSARPAKTSTPTMAGGPAAKSSAKNPRKKLGESRAASMAGAQIFAARRPDHRSNRRRRWGS